MQLTETNQALKVSFGFAGGDSNLYEYVVGDPVNFIDPKGLMSKKMMNSLHNLDYDAVEARYCNGGFPEVIIYCSTFLGNKNAECRTYVSQLVSDLVTPNCSDQDRNNSCKI